MVYVSSTVCYLDLDNKLTKTLPKKLSAFFSVMDDVKPIK